MKTEKLVLKLSFSDFSLTEFWCTKHRVMGSCSWYLKRKVKIILPPFILVETLTEIPCYPNPASSRFHLLVTAMLQFAWLKTWITFSSVWNHYPGKICKPLKWHNEEHLIPFQTCTDKNDGNTSWEKGS